MQPELRVIDGVGQPKQLLKPELRVIKGGGQKPLKPLTKPGLRVIKGGGEIPPRGPQAKAAELPMAVGETGKSVCKIDVLTSGEKSFKIQLKSELEVSKKTNSSVVEIVDQLEFKVEKFHSELDVLEQRAREMPRTLTEDEIRACEAVKLQMKGKFPGPGKVSVAEVEKIDGAVRATNEAEEVKSVIESDIPYQDATGKWHRANGQFALNTEVGIISGSSHYLSRPYIRKETIEAVNANTRVDYKTGQIYDSISKKWVDPSNVELGHKTGKEFPYLRDWAESQGMTQSQFNDFMNNPEFYAWQNISSNRSHMFEAKN